MRIGIDCRLFSSNFTGIGRYTHELVDHFIKFIENTEHELVLFFNSPEYKKFQSPNEQVEKVLVNAKHYSLSEQIKFCRKLYKAKLDICHFPHFNVPILYRKPYLVTIHDLTLSLFPGNKMTKWYHRFAYHLVIKNAINSSKKVIAVSENTKEDIIEHFSTSPEKIHTIHNGVSPVFRLLQDPQITKATLKKHKITKQFLLYTGVWRNHKNLPGLLQAFHILKTEKNLDLQLVITGKPDPHYPEVKNTIIELQLSDDVILPGLVSEEELIHLYNASMLYVFPSFYEGFGLPPLESMRCGTPVLASNTSSIPEICGSDSAIYFNPYNPQDIADKIEYLYKDAALQAELVAQGLKHSTKFTWEKSAEQSYELICGSASHKPDLKSKTKL